MLVNTVMACECSQPLHHFIIVTTCNEVMAIWWLECVYI